MTCHVKNWTGAVTVLAAQHQGVFVNELKFNFYNLGQLVTLIQIIITTTKIFIKFGILVLFSFIINILCNINLQPSTKKKTIKHDSQSNSIMRVIWKVCSYRMKVNITFLFFIASWRHGRSITSFEFTSKLPPILFSWFMIAKQCEPLTHFTENRSHDNSYHNDVSSQLTKKLSQTIF